MHMALSFKNVGVRTDYRAENPLITKRSVLPIGIRTPVQLSDDTNELFVMHTSLKDQIKDNLKNLLLTNHGERVIQYDFGANLRPILSEFFNKETFDAEAMLRINTAITKFMPFVSPLEFEANQEYLEKEKVSVVKIHIIYSIPELQVLRDDLEITLTVL